MKKCDHRLKKHCPQSLHISSVSTGSSAAVAGSATMRFPLIGCLVVRGWAFRGAGGLLEEASFVKESSVLRAAARTWALGKAATMLSGEKGGNRVQYFFQAESRSAPER